MKLVRLAKNLMLLAEDNYWIEQPKLLRNSIGALYISCANAPSSFGLLFVDAASRRITCRLA